MKKIILVLSLFAVFLLVGCSEDATVDKEANPESGVVVFIGYDKNEYYIVEGDEKIMGEGSGYIEIDLGKGEKFNSNDVYYKHIFKDKKSLNKILVKYGHEPIK